MIFIVNADNKFNLCLITKHFTVLILFLEITIQTRVKLYLRVLKYKLLAYIDSYSMLMYFVFFILLYFLFFHFNGTFSNELVSVIQFPSSVSAKREPLGMSGTDFLQTRCHFCHPPKVYQSTEWNTESSLCRL